MMPVLLFLTPTWPLLLLALLVALRSAGASRTVFGWLWLTAPLPGLLLAALATGDPADTSLEMPWLLLGSLWWVDEVRQVFLLTTSLLWLFAGIYARGYLGARADSDRLQLARLRSFEYLWLLTLAGNLLLLIAEDIPSFYTGFVVMSFSAYGLVIHFRSPEALRAGRSYLYLAVLGEGFMLAGFLGTAAQVPEPMMSQIPLILEPDNVSALPLMICLLLGFGVKAGLPLLHVWLPVAHSVAPTPASAVLSGAMIKAGLLGWWLTLPLGSSNWPQVGQVLIVAGLVAVLGAALLGSLQSRAKAVLAYSSISQMGMMTSLLGVGLNDLTLWPLLVPALLLFVAHHGLNKGSLFLAVGIAEKLKTRWAPLLWIALLLSPLALVGWLGSGTLTKTLMKSSLYSEGWSQLVFWLTLGLLGTTLLMVRYLWLLQQMQQQLAEKQTPSPWMLASWLLLLPLALLVPWWLPLPESTPLAWPDQKGWIGLAWPVMVAFVLAVMAWALTRKSSRWQNYAPPAGDLLIVYQQAGRSLVAAFERGVGWLQKFSQAGQKLFIGLRKLEPWLLRISQQEIAWRREAALLFSFLLVLLSGLLLL
ncbi:complex I subunit 5 family protein [Marinospirillum sp.]|uniref:complex I subunit 5 family protein n=1 Tax=Marinospirillum sp. TaxID=2183934 RepID=UPI0028706CAD|nr:complex I subunit 5 family protein [Marinospirillum sp.]MDR9467481.1 complex I subunit 5 family protein [Marinospirillum sp.]